MCFFSHPSPRHPQQHNSLSETDLQTKNCFEVCSSSKHIHQASRKQKCPVPCSIHCDMFASFIRVICLYIFYFLFVPCLCFSHGFIPPRLVQPMGLSQRRCYSFASCGCRRQHRCGDGTPGRPGQCERHQSSGCHTLALCRGQRGRWSRWGGIDERRLEGDRFHHVASLTMLHVLGENVNVGFPLGFLSSRCQVWWLSF